MALEALKEKLKEYREKNPHSYLRNIAQDLNSSEEQLLSLNCGENVFRLRFNLNEVLKKCESLDRVTVIVRNDFAVSEISGKLSLKFTTEEIHGNIEQSQLVVDRKHLKAAYFVKDQNRNSLQVYDQYGDAAVKFFFQGFDDLFADFYHNNQSPVEEVLRQAAGDKRASVVELKSFPVATIRQIINLAAESTTDIAIDVESYSAVLSYRGKISTVKDARGWFNILDPNFNLHLKEEAITKVFSVAEKSPDSLTSLTIVAEDTTQRVLAIVIEKNFLSL